jgi:hypothetical protein
MGVGGRGLHHHRLRIVEIWATLCMITTKVACSFLSFQNLTQIMGSYRQMVLYRGVVDAISDENKSEL